MTLRRSLVALVLGALYTVTLAAPLHAESRDDPTLQPATSRQPAYSDTQALGHELSRLRIPAIGMDQIIRSGVAQDVIDQGVAHWVGTSSPGGPGNVVLAGHRTTFTAPFYDLDRLQVGDLIYLTDASGFEVMYRVFDTFVIEPTDIWITYETGDPIVTMFACHPKGSAAQRIVVRGELVGGRPLA